MDKLLEKINQDLKAAMMAKDAETLSTLRMLIAAVRNKEIALRTGGKVELSDEQVVEVVASETKKRRDSIEAYKQGGRPELAEKEEQEIAIMRKYLPAQLSDEDLEKVVKEVVASGLTDFGRVMGQVMGRVKGQADGAKVGEIVKRILGK